MTRVHNFAHPNPNSSALNLPTFKLSNPRTFFVSLATALLLLAALSASAQNGPATGTPPFGSFAGGPDVINLGNLNAHLAIGVLNKPGRGTNFTYDLTYDTSVWYPLISGGTTAWTAVNNWGWTGSIPNITGYATYKATARSCRFFQETQWVTEYYTQYAFMAYVDSRASSHLLGGGVVQDGGAPDCGPPQTATATTGDGSGYKVFVSGTPDATLFTPTGGVAGLPLNIASPGTTLTDRNGNQSSSDTSGHFYDTLSSTTPVLTVVSTGSPTTQTTLTYTAPSGAPAIYTVSYVAYTVATNFAVSGINEYGAQAIYLVDKVTLPDGSFYQFNYEQTPSTPASGACTPRSGTFQSYCVTARVTKLALPAGGSITYSYTGGAGTNNSGIWNDGSAATLTRTTPDGTWIYARTQVSGTEWKTLVTDPASAANQTLIYFQKDGAGTNNFYETQRQVYQGSTSGTLLRQWMTCYNGNGTPSTCATTTVSSPIMQRNVTDQYGSSGLQCEHNYFYNSLGGLTEQDDYDYGPSGQGGAPLRKILVTYAPLGNITAFRQQVTVKNGSGTVVSQTNYNYDETTPTTTSVAQHTSVSGSRGNLTSINYPVSGLTSHFTYYDTGSPNTSQDVNGATTTYNYSNNTADCQMAFPTSISEPLSLSRSMTWNCTGGAQLTSTDENNQTTTVTYNDADFWRPNAVTDQLGNQTGFYYQPNPTYSTPWEVASYMTFNNGNSVVSDIQYKDGLGRTYVDQHWQSPNSSTLDSVSYTFDSNGRPYSVSMPCSIGYAGTCSTPKTTLTYDALNRPLQTTDAGGGTVTYSYSNNDVLVAVGPAPSGENTKQRQLEYDALGRLTSVCEITSGTTAWPGASCGQNTSATGYLTKYTYDVLGNLLTVTQNAQSSSNQQTRSFGYDAMSRLTSETNAESGTTTYTYDTDSTCGTSKGDRVKKTDAIGNVTCTAYDALHRPTSITYPSGSYASVTPSRYFAYDNPCCGWNLSNTKGRLWGGHTCFSPCSSLITDVVFSFTARGEVSDIYESTPHSGGYYHVTETYWPHGAPSQLSNLVGLPTINYGGTIGSTVGLDGEGRVTQVTAASGQNPVTGVSYNTGSLPTQVNFGSGDADIFAYDLNTLRTTQFKFNVGTQPQYLNGALSWNANGTLGQLAITDQFNSANTQTCSYSHDDLVRIASANCGSAANQTFSFDPFGNINKSGSPNQFQPTYNPATNRFSSVPGCSPLSYDNNGNLTNDCNHTYTWDADGNSVAVDSVGLTFDAFNRMVEQNRSGSYTQIVYGPGGGKLALMNGQSLVKAFVPLPGQASAFYTGSGLDHYRHSDHLGSARLTSSPSQTYISSLAYAPFGETYASNGTTDPSFTGQNPDTTGSTTSSDYDFLAREYSNEGRWASPDPAGLAAVDPANPQSWNRYAYVLNNPLLFVDPSGLDTCYWDYVSYELICIPEVYDSVTVYGGVNDAGTGTFAGGGAGAEGMEDPGSYLWCVRNLHSMGVKGNLAALCRAAKLLTQLKNAVCSAVPQGKVVSLGNYWGGVGSVGGSIDVVSNYNTGEVSGFATGGFQGGWNGGVSLTGSMGFIYGLGNSNTAYSGPFKGGNFSVSVPEVPFANVGGSVTHASNGVTVVSATGGLALAGKIGGGGSYTITSNPLPLGQFSNFSAGDYAAYLARQLCKN